MTVKTKKNFIANLSEKSLQIITFSSITVVLIGILLLLVNLDFYLAALTDQAEKMTAGMYGTATVFLGLVCIILSLGALLSFGMIFISIIYGDKDKK